MFAQLGGAFSPDFQPENYLSSLEQVECYKARAKALRPRFPWSNQLLPVWNATLVHLSANVPGKVAYYASVPNLMNNRLTRTSPEMFLERALAYAPDEITAAWGCEVLGKTLPEVKFIANNDPDGWYEIYRDGPSSCMAGAPYVRQYAHPKNNLALAYAEKDNRITHRTIVNTKTMKYIRIYSRDEVGPFVAALNKLGYSHSYETLAGELINLSWQSCYRCDRDVLMGPYLDGNSQGVNRLNSKEGTIGGFNEICSGEEAYCGCEESSEDDEDGEY